MIVDGDEVDKKSGSTDQGGQEEGWHQHLPDPHLDNKGARKYQEGEKTFVHLSSHPGVQATTEIATDRGSRGVNENCRR